MNPTTPPTAPDEPSEGEPDALLDDLVRDEPDGEQPDHADGDAVTLTALIEEFYRDIIDTLWMAEFRSAVSRVARRYPPRRYRAGAAWNPEALEDLSQDLVVRLLHKKQLLYICENANDLPHARALLRRQVRLTLVDRLRRTAIDNLVRRAVERLSEAPFTQVSAAPLAWAVESAAPTPPGTGPALDRDEFTRLSQRLRFLPRVPHHGLERATPIWPAEVLFDALHDICATYGTVTRTELEEIFNDALTTLNVAEFLDVEAAEQFVAADLGPEVEALVSDLVTRAVSSLTDEEVVVLAGKFRGLSDDAVSTEVGRSRPTVAARKDSGAAKLRDVVAGLDAAAHNAFLEQVQVRILGEQR
jgi:hypothetical protein